MRMRFEKIRSTKTAKIEKPFILGTATIAEIQEQIKTLKAEREGFRSSGDDMTKTKQEEIDQFEARITELENLQKH